MARYLTWSSTKGLGKNATEIIKCLGLSMALNCLQGTRK